MFKEIKSQTILFAMLFIALLIAKTNEDFGYYHLPNYSICRAKTSIWAWKFKSWFQTH